MAAGDPSPTDQESEPCYDEDDEYRKRPSLHLPSLSDAGAGGAGLRFDCEEGGAVAGMDLYAVPIFLVMPAPMRRTRCNGR